MSTKLGKKIKNIIDFLFRGEYNINKNKEKEKKQMREKLLAMKATAERDILYAQAKLEVIENLLSEQAEVQLCVADVACESVEQSSMDTI